MRQADRVLAHDEMLGAARLVFTDRLGGTSGPPYDALNLALHTGDDPDRVAANRDLLARELGVAALVFGDQVHGSAVAVVTGPRAGAVPATDALVTTERGVGLVMMGADCLPVLLAAAGVVGAAHVGRAGLAAGVLVQLLRVMREHGAREVTARIGPGICAGCYEVPAELADAVEAAAPGSRATTRAGTPAVDLAAGARRQLLEAGVEDVAAVSGCTLEQPERFFSYRRDGATGRHAGVVVLT
jgi:YfiH family protein